MNCRICGTASAKAFEGTLLGKYTVAYHQCPKCLFLQTDEPYWLEEAYASSINLADTGIMARNLLFSRIASVLIYSLFDRGGRFLDYAGGYGLFTRLMRDIGFDFRWQDPYTENLVARGFEYGEGGKPVELLTAFEAFEHFVDPVAELDKILAISRNVLFSTELLPHPAPRPGEWWYYGPEHGQHVSFYSRRSLEVLASMRGLRFRTNGAGLHMFSEKRVNPRLFAFLCKLAPRGLAGIVAKRMRSLTLDDMRASAVAETRAGA